MTRTHATTTTIKLLIFSLCLLLQHLQPAQCAILAYADPYGSGTNCTLDYPCNINYAASLFTGTAANQGVLILQDGEYQLNSTVVFPFTKGSISIGGGNSGDAIIDCYRASEGEASTAFQFALDPSFRGNIYLQNIRFKDCATSLVFADAPSTSNSRSVNQDGPGVMTRATDIDVDLCKCTGSFYLNNLKFSNNLVAIKSTLSTNFYLEDCNFEHASIFVHPPSTSTPEIEFNDCRFVGSGSTASPTNGFHTRDINGAARNMYTLDITNAVLYIQGTKFDGCSSSAGISVNSSTISLSRCSFKEHNGNGAITAHNAYATSLSQVSFNNNKAANGNFVQILGYNSKYQFKMTDCNVQSNEGAIYVTGFSGADISRLNLHNNSATLGPTLSLYADNIAFASTTVTGNQALDAIISTAATVLTIANSSFTDNLGNAIWQNGGNITMTGSLFSGNIAKFEGAAIRQTFGKDEAATSMCICCTSFSQNYPNDLYTLATTFVSVAETTFNGNTTVEIPPLFVNGTSDFLSCMRDNGPDFVGTITGYSYPALGYSCFLTPHKLLSCYSAAFLQNSSAEIPQECRGLIPPTNVTTTTTGFSSNNNKAEKSGLIALYVLGPLAFVVAAFIGAVKLFQKFSDRAEDGAGGAAISDVQNIPDIISPALARILSPKAAGSGAAAAAAAGGEGSGRRLSLVHGVIIGATIGKGAFGHVYEGKWNGVKVALKSIPNENANILLSEAAVLKSLRHPNIVQFIGLYAADGSHYMVTEFVEGGSLEYLLHWQPGFFTYRDVVRLARDAAAGMLLLEQKSIIHRDLAARNLLVDVTRQDLTLKVADFGMARVVTSVYQGNRDTPFPVKWSAPEVLLYHKYSSKSDVWSFGIVLWEMLTYGKSPYIGMTNKEASDYVLKGNRLTIPTKAPPPLSALIKRCWHFYPEDRPKFSDIYQTLNTLVEAPKEYDMPDFDEPAVNYEDLPLPSPILQEFAHRRGISKPSSPLNSLPSSPPGPLTIPHTPSASSHKNLTSPPHPLASSAKLKPGSAPPSPGLPVTPSPPLVKQLAAALARLAPRPPPTPTKTPSMSSVIPPPTPPTLASSSLATSTSSKLSRSANTLRQFFTRSSPSIGNLYEQISSNASPATVSLRSPPNYEINLRASTPVPATPSSKPLNYSTSSSTPSTPANLPISRPTNRPRSLTAPEPLSPSVQQSILSKEMKEDRIETATEQPPSHKKDADITADDKKIDTGPSPLMQFMLRLSTQLFQPLDYSTLPPDDSTDSQDNNNNNSNHKNET